MENYFIPIVKKGFRKVMKIKMPTLWEANVGISNFSLLPICDRRAIQEY
jgi:hypothetical protein